MKENYAMTTTFVPDSERLNDLQLYQVTDAMRMLRLGKTVIYELIRSGRLRSVKQGRARRIPATAIRDYITLLEEEAGR
jgi:excisionase family DNA binding protein